MLFCLAFADDDSLGRYFDDTSTYLEQQGQGFVQATGAAGSGIMAGMGAVGGSFSSSSCGTDWPGGDLAGTLSIIGLWLAPSVLAGLVVLLGLVCIYMVGILFGTPNLIAFAKDEAFQTGLTFMRVAFVAGILLSGHAWYTVSASPSDPIYSHNQSMIDAAMAFARQMVSDMVTNYSMLIIYNTVIHTIYSSTMWFGITWRAMYSFNLGPVLRPIIDLVGTTLQFLSLGMSEWLLHIVTLCLIKRWMWSFFIPVGMLLRALPHTRAAGEALLALAFALVIFYPFMFLVDYEVHKLMKGNLVDPKAAMSSFIHKSGILNVFGAVLVVLFLMGGVFMPFFLGSALTLAFELIKGAVYYVMIISLLLPFLNIFITLTAAKETAKFFNVDVNYMSFLKII